MSIRVLTRLTGLVLVPVLVPPREEAHLHASGRAGCGQSTLDASQRPLATARLCHTGVTPGHGGSQSAHVRWSDHSHTPSSASPTNDSPDDWIARSLRGLPAARQKHKVGRPQTPSRQARKVSPFTPADFEHLATITSTFLSTRRRSFEARAAAPSDHASRHRESRGLLGRPTLRGHRRRLDCTPPAVFTASLPTERRRRRHCHGHRDWRAGASERC